MRDRLAYGVLLAVGIVDAIGYGIIGPIVPAISEATGAGPAVMGALVAMFGIGLVIGFWFAGKGVQRTSPMAVIVASLLLSAVAAAGFLLAPSLPIYFAARFLMGFAAGGLWLGAAFAAMERWPGDEYRRLSGLMAVYSAGAIAGPALAGVGGIRGPFALYIGLVVLVTLLLPLLGAPHVHAPAFRSDRAVLRNPSFGVSTAAITLVAVTIATFDGVLPLHFDERLGQSGIAALYACAGIVIALATVLAARLAMRRAVVAGTILIVGRPEPGGSHRRALVVGDRGRAGSGRVRFRPDRLARIPARRRRARTNDPRDGRLVAGVRDRLPRRSVARRARRRDARVCAIGLVPAVFAPRSSPTLARATRRAADQLTG